MKTQPLVAEELTNDSRIQQAKELVLAAIRDHQKNLTGTRPPDPQRKQIYEELLYQFSECRGSKLWHPYLGSGIGRGVLVELLDGSVKYDLISGIGVHYLGHSHPALIQASLEAALSDTVMQGQLQQNGDSVKLAAQLCECAGLPHCFFSTSGAMANENALKIAFQKRFPASRVLAFDNGFAGRTLALAQITDKPSFREGLPSALAVDYLPFYDFQAPEQSTQRMVTQLKKHLMRHPNEYAVMFCELVQGERGFYPGSREFFLQMIEILKENNISILFDEVQTFGRTPALFAFQHFGLEAYADIVTIGKLSHVCATLFNKEHRPRPGLLSQTFTSSTAAIRAAQAILEELISGHYFGPEGKIVKLHHTFSQKLEELSIEFPQLIAGPFGIGTMIAFTPFGGDSKRVAQFSHDLFEEGVISFIAGNDPTRIRFLIPAGVITIQDVDAVISIIKKVLTQT